MWGDNSSSQLGPASRSQLETQPARIPGHQLRMALGDTPRLITCGTHHTLLATGMCPASHVLQLVAPWRGIEHIVNLTCCRARACVHLGLQHFGSAGSRRDAIDHPTWHTFTSAIFRNAIQVHGSRNRFRNPEPVS
jgi:hypothetical protein